MDKSQNSKTTSQSERDATIFVQIFVAGRVQGVGFRRFVQKQALEICVQGWVRNLFDGRVEARVKGPKYLIDQFVEKVKKGPVFSHVEFITMNPIDEFTVEDGSFSVIADGEYRGGS